MLEHESDATLTGPSALRGWSWPSTITARLGIRIGSIPSPAIILQQRRSYRSLMVLSRASTKFAFIYMQRDVAQSHVIRERLAGSCRASIAMVRPPLHTDVFAYSGITAGCSSARMRHSRRGFWLARVTSVSGNASKLRHLLNAAQKLYSVIEDFDMQRQRISAAANVPRHHGDRPKLAHGAGAGEHHAGRPAPSEYWVE